MLVLMLMLTMIPTTPADIAIKPSLRGAIYIGTS
jgi:hypothetical protein